MYQRIYEYRDHMFNYSILNEEEYEVALTLWNSYPDFLYSSLSTFLSYFLWITF